MEPNILTAIAESFSRDADASSTQQSPRGARRNFIPYCAGVFAALCLAQLAGTAPAEAQPTAQQGGLEEVIVTAEKTKSTVQDVPISLSALSGADLEKGGITTIQEIAREVPSVSVRYASPGLTEYEARGLASNGGAAPTVGFYLDEIPLSPPALSQSGKVVIDPNLYDINRVEVLRGPQGTLYGSGSMGGTVKVITNQPKLGTWEGSVQATLSGTQGGSGNYGGNVALNVPLGDMFALRLVGGYTYRSGWVDNITVSPFPIDPATKVYGDLLAAPVQGVVHQSNDMRLSGGRVALLFQPNDAIAITASFFDQKMSLGGYDLLDSTPTSPAPGPLYNGHYQPFDVAEGIHDDIQIYGLTMIFNLGFADLTSATSYFDRHGVQTEESSASIYWTNNSSGAPPQPPLVPIAYSEVDPSRQFSQELRLTSHDTGRLHWVAGAFYSELNSVWNEVSNNPILTQPPFNIPDGSYFTSNNPYRVKQYAIFADGSYAITSHWKFAAGLRWYKYDSQQHEQSWGWDAPAATPPEPTLTQAHDNGYNPRFNLSYQPTKNLNLYATAAKGFRPGGANQIIPPPNLPPFCTPGTLAFQPDSVWNYEIGEKARLADNRVTINGALYYIDWHGVQQVFTLTCGYQYYNNAGDGRSYGPEIEIEAKLTNELLLSLSGSYTDAKVTKPTAAYQQYLSQQVTGPDGVTHPCPVSGSCVVPIMNVAKETANIALTYTRPFGNYEFTARIADAFVGSTPDLAYYFGYTLPSYNIADLRFIVAHGNWSVHAFVDNLTNKAALITANNTSFQFNIPQLVRYSTNPPRTYGTQVNYRF